MGGRVGQTYQWSPLFCKERGPRLRVSRRVDFFRKVREDRCVYRSHCVQNLKCTQYWLLGERLETYLLEYGYDTPPLGAHTRVGVETIFRDIEIQRGKGDGSEVAQGTHDCSKRIGFEWHVVRERYNKKSQTFGEVIGGITFQRGLL